MVPATPCLSYVVVPRADFRVARRDARFCSKKNSKTAGGSAPIFSQQKIGRSVRNLQQDSAERAFNRTNLSAQVEMLKRYRDGGEQTMPRAVATARGGHCASPACRARRSFVAVLFVVRSRSTVELDWLRIAHVDVSEACRERGIKTVAVTSLYLSH